jgi:hypothetical protein
MSAGVKYFEPADRARLSQAPGNKSYTAKPALLILGPPSAPLSPGCRRCAARTIDPLAALRVGDTDEAHQGSARDISPAETCSESARLLAERGPLSNVAMRTLTSRSRCSEVGPALYRDRGSRWPTRGKTARRKAGFADTAHGSWHHLQNILNSHFGEIGWVPVAAAILGLAGSCP